MKRLLKLTAAGVILLILLLFILFTTLDRTPLEEQPFYKATLSTLDSTKLVTTSDTGSLKAGWARVSITPTVPRPIAAYGINRLHTQVADSLYVRVLVLQKGPAWIAFVSADLLLFPPQVKKALLEALKPSDFDFIHFGATHTHSSIGGWDTTPAGKLVTGSYSKAHVDTLALKTMQALQQARQSMLPATLSYGQKEASHLVGNRLTRGGGVDGFIRSLIVYRNDSSSACLFTFSAHATSQHKNSVSLSADYPSVTIKRLEEKQYSFAMYLAGMVGSHRIKFADDNNKGDKLTQAYGTAVAEQLLSMAEVVVPQPDRFEFCTVPITFGPPQLRIAKHFRIRPWLFKALLGDLKGSITMLKIGELVFISTPCDFSGELFQSIRTVNAKVLITSFNGNYVGYITHDTAYDTSPKAEVRTLNWVGPYHGQFFVDVINRMLEK